MIDIIVNGLMLTGILFVGALTFFFTVVALLHGLFGWAE